jgi:hypothetical protein
VESGSILKSGCGVYYPSNEVVIAKSGIDANGLLWNTKQ